MTNKQSYEMIQAGAGAAALERGEEGSLIAGTEPRRKGWVAPALAAAVGVALLLACGLSAHAREDASGVVSGWKTADMYCCRFTTSGAQCTQQCNTAAIASYCRENVPNTRVSPM